ncbi:DegT/DnrJ/EryC1/StrS family aminotransferase [filamentous cyanobacterium LEGE 11480]|uniref:DegT/DnrJ/EryC1/StrS family aminotransferase n=1 Tax=Romeriopsis navalis LEGE 11480 TaxID=2777977 RepID=A0A928VIC1_9CYAN|nr:DegT/DnrJ/EryC1/StrS family aminotransferase [Romeriopsis navalis]MBE9029136.1 DegT/DnrJ/EryC1/StrS family aminotransferase [Romeriopsis navalis LEGE 11480]
MSSLPATVPFVDLSAQHDALQAEMFEAMQAVLQRGDYVLGQAVTDFEAAFAQASAMPYGIGVACGTDAIALGLQACGIGPEDEVILPANTFVATLIGVLRCGAKPVLVDCDPLTGLIDLVAVEHVITPSTRAIIPVHLYGQMVSPSQLLTLADTYGLIIFEDAAQAHLAEREGYKAGSIGTASAFSFYPSKNLGALGDGGIVLTRDEAVAAQLRALRNYGAPRKYYHTEIGTNSRLDSIQAAILNVKLPHLGIWNQTRHEIAEQYNILLSPFKAQGIIPLQNQADTGHVYHLYTVRILSGEDGNPAPISREVLQERLTAAGVETGIHYPLPCHLQPAFAGLGYRAGDFPVAEQMSQEILSLPMYPGLTEAQINQVVGALTDAIETPMPMQLSA